MTAQILDILMPHSRAHYSTDCFRFVCVLHSFLWQLPFCALSMEHFPHNWLFPCGPHARQHESTRHDRSVLRVIRNSLAYLEQPAVALAASPSNTGCCMRPRLSYGRQTAYALSQARSRSPYLPLSLCVLTFAWAGEQCYVVRRTPF